MRPLQNESSGGFLHPTQTGSVGNGEGSSSKVTTSHEGLESSPITVNTPDSRQNAQPPSWEELIAMKAPEHLVQSNLSSPFNLSVVVLAVLVGAFLALVSMPVLPALVLCALLACYMLHRHAKLVSCIRKNARTVGKVWLATNGSPGEPSTADLPAVYFYYIFGSGGHTTELCETILKKMRAAKNMHRRYLITEGDMHSLNRIYRVESIISDAYLFASSGTWDMAAITRARKVHQSYVTSIFTSLWSAWEVIHTLTERPRSRGKDLDGKNFKWPHVLITNGPGTGFVVAMVVHLLKIFHLVPEERLKVVYIETWAQVTRLSLTGKLFYWTDIADLFIIQHEKLAAKYGKLFIDQVSRRTTPEWHEQYESRRA